MSKNNQKKSQPQTRKAFLLELLKMIGVILVAIVVIVGLFYAGWFIKVNIAQSSMREYLQKKYNQEFVVENYRVEGSGFGVEGDPTADAYPKNNPALRFQVWDSSDSSGHHYYTSNFLESLWSHEGKVEAAKIVNSLDNVDSYRLNIKPMSSKDSDVALVEGRTVSLSEALSKYPSDVKYVLSVRSVHDSFEPQPSNYALQQASKLARGIQGIEALNKEGYYIYRIKSASKNSDASKDYQYSIHITDDNLHSTNNESLISKFKELR